MTTKYYIIIAHNGVEIIDDTPEAEDRIESMEYLEIKRKREQRKENKQKRKMAQNPLYRFAGLCGIV